MRQRLIFLFLLMILWGCDSTNTLRDPGDSFFLKFYGADGDQTGDDFVVLSDGSFILFGTTRPSGVERMSQWYLVKTDPKGNILWEKTYGGPNDEEASDIELTNDNRIVLVGNTHKSAADRDVKIMTLTMDGVGIDSAVVPIYTSSGTDPLGDENAVSVTQTSDGFIIAGSTTYVPVGNKTVNSGYTDPRDGINIRLNNNLTAYTLNGWPMRQSNGFYADDVTQKIYQNPDGSFYLFGYSNRPADNQTTKNYNFWYYQLGLSGTSVNFNLLGAQTEDERLSSAIKIPVESGDGFLIAGVTSNVAVTSSTAISTDINVVRLKKSLIFNPTPPPAYPPDELYQKTITLKLGSSLPEKTSVFATRSNSFYVLGNENAFNNNQNWVLTKGNINDGTAIWSLPIVFGGEGLDICGAVQELPDGRVAIVGTMRTGKPDVGELKMTLIKVNQDGKLAN